MLKSVPVKTCRACLTEKLASDFHSRKDAPDGLRNECKSCVRSRQRAYHHEHRETEIARSKERYSVMKDSWNSARREARLAMTAEERAAESASKKAYYLANKERIRSSARARNALPEEKAKVRERNRLYYEANLQRIREWGREYRSANRERINENSRAWYQKNRELVSEKGVHYRSSRKEQIRAYQAAYRAANPGAQHKATTARKRRLDSVLVIVPTPEQIAAKWAYWGDQCWMCGGDADTLDHVKPLAALGPHILANFRPACKPCNSRKHSKWDGPRALKQFIINRH